MTPATLLWRLSDDGGEHESAVRDVPEHALRAPDDSDQVAVAITIAYAGSGRL